MNRNQDPRYPVGGGAAHFNRPGRFVPPAPHLQVDQERRKAIARPHVPRDPFRHVRDNKVFNISATRLKKWHAKLEEVEVLRQDMEELAIAGPAKVRLLARTERMKTILSQVKAEVRGKLES